MAAKIAWAIDQIGAYRHVRDVQNGKACNCTCLHCGDRLIACHPDPKKKTAYFAHYNGSICSGESVLHKLAKKVLEELAERQCSIRLPPYYAEAVGEDSIGSPVYSSYDIPLPILKMQQAVSEQAMGSVIMDSVTTNAEGDKFGIEIYVRNRKTDADKLKFEELPVEVMEIDLSNISWSIEREDLEKLLLNGANRRWLNNLGQKHAKALAEHKLPHLTALRNQQITNVFDKLTKQTIANSSVCAIPIKTLASNPQLLNNNTHFSLKKRISVRNIRHANNDLLGSWGELIADVIVDDKLNGKKPIPIIFIPRGTVKQRSSPNIIFRLTWDSDAEIFSLKPTLRGVKKWRIKLEDLASSEAEKRNLSYEAISVERYQFLKELRSKPHERVNLLTERYSVKIGPNDTAAEAWELPDKLWAPLFIEFTLFKFRGRTVEVNQLVDDDTLDRVLNLSLTYKSKARRASAIRKLLDFLKVLHVVGNVEPLSFCQIGKKGPNRFALPHDISDRTNIKKLLNYYPRPLIQ